MHRTAHMDEFQHFQDRDSLKYSKPFRLAQGIMDETGIPIVWLAYPTHIQFSIPTQRATAVGGRVE